MDIPPLVHYPLVDGGAKIAITQNPTVSQVFSTSPKRYHELGSGRAGDPFVGFELKDLQMA